MAETFLATFAGALARPLVALRLAGAAFLLVFEALFLRVFCDTACARNCHAPVRCLRNHRGQTYALAKFGLYNVPNIAHFPQKSMIYGRFRPVGDVSAISPSTGLNPQGYLGSASGPKRAQPARQAVWQFSPPRRVPWKNISRTCLPYPRILSRRAASPSSG